MPSTRKQKAKERRSRQLDIMSDVENVDIMLEVMIEMMKEQSRVKVNLIWTQGPIDYTKIQPW